MSPTRTEIKSLATLAAPVVVTQVSTMMLGVVDTIMVGHVSVEALGAATLGHVWIIATLMLTMGIIFGIDPIVAQAHGSKNVRRLGLGLLSDGGRHLRRHPPEHLPPGPHRIRLHRPAPPGRHLPARHLLRGRVDGGRATTLEPAQPIGAIAVKNLDNRKGRIAVKAIARATTKYLANRALQAKARERSEGAGLLAWAAGNVFSEVSEQADLRSWQTLPDRVLIGRVLLPSGKHAIEVELTTSSGATVATRNLGEVELRAGQTRFFILHTLN